MEKIRLGDIASYINGYAFKPSDWCNEGLPIIRIQDLTGSSYQLNYYNGDYPKKIEINDGDVLISWSASLGVYIWSKGKALLNQHIFKVVFDKAEIDKKYFVFAIQYKLNEMKNKMHGATMKHIVKKDFDNITIPFPEINEQKAIAMKLHKIEDLIRKREQQLNQIDILIKSRFVEMFDIEHCRLGSFGEDTEFVDYRGKTPELSDVGTIRMVNAKSVGKGFFKDVDEFVTEETYDNWMCRGFGYPGDVLFVTEGHTFGNTCQVPRNLTKFALGQRVITIKGHADVLDNAFLCAYMQTDRFFGDILAYRTGGTAQGIRSKDLVKVCIPLCDLEKQKQFATFVAQIDKSKLSVQKSLEELETLKNALMQKYFG